MNVRTILWLVGVVLGVVALAQTASLVTAVVLGEPWQPFAVAVGLGVALGALCLLPARGVQLSLDHRSAFMAVTLAWVSACLLGAVPFLHNESLQISAVNAVFEATSGFTTTGATVLSGLDELPRSVLLWRSLSQWMGGLGMVLLGIAVFPILGLGGMQLFKAEAPGPTKDKLTPRIAETAKLLWVLYLGLTVVHGGLLYLGDMSAFDAVCHAMTTISTAGFSTHDTSLGFYDSGYINVVTSIFMLLGGTSFAILHSSLTRGIPWADHPELRLYFGIFLLVVLLITLDLRFGSGGAYPDTAEALEHAAFQTASILSTTGFSTQNFDAWPPLSHAAILGLWFVGSMAGSTGGGVKVIRVLVLVRLAFSQFFRLVHPHGYGTIKLGGTTVDDEVMLSVLGFIGMWIVVLGLGTALLCLLGSELYTGFSAAAVTLGNIGPGFGGVGPATTYDHFEPAAKLVMSGLMILGRLEIYTALVILTPGFWRR